MALNMRLDSPSGPAVARATVLVPGLHLAPRWRYRRKSLWSSGLSYNHAEFITGRYTAWVACMGSSQQYLTRQYVLPRRSGLVIGLLARRSTSIGGRPPSNTPNDRHTVTLNDLDVYVA